MIKNPLLFFGSAIVVGIMVGVFGSFSGGKEKSQPKEVEWTQTELTILETSDSTLNGRRTYIRDSHGHYTTMTGIWGKSGDTLPGKCAEFPIGIKIVLQ